MNLLNQLDTSGSTALVKTLDLVNSNFNLVDQALSSYGSVFSLLYKTKESSEKYQSVYYDPLTNVSQYNRQGIGFNNAEPYPSIQGIAVGSFIDFDVITSTHSLKELYIQLDTRGQAGVSAFVSLDGSPWMSIDVHKDIVTNTTFTSAKVRLEWTIKNVKVFSLGVLYDVRTIASSSDSQLSEVINLDEGAPELALVPLSGQFLPNGKNLSVFYQNDTTSRYLLNNIDYEEASSSSIRLLKPLASGKLILSASLNFSQITADLFQWKTFSGSLTNNLLSVSTTHKDFVGRALRIWYDGGFVQTFILSVINDTTYKVAIDLQGTSTILSVGPESTASIPPYLLEMVNDLDRRYTNVEAWYNAVNSWYLELQQSYILAGQRLQEMQTLHDNVQQLTLQNQSLKSELQLYQQKTDNIEKYLRAQKLSKDFDLGLDPPLKI